MTELILTIKIIIPLPDNADKPEPVYTKDQPPVCRCHETDQGRRAQENFFIDEKMVILESRVLLPKR